jgi:hypothetical protein
MLAGPARLFFSRWAFVSTFRLGSALPLPPTRLIGEWKSATRGEIPLLIHLYDLMVVLIVCLLSNTVFESIILTCYIGYEEDVQSPKVWKLAKGVSSKKRFIQKRRGIAAPAMLCCICFPKSSCCCAAKVCSFCWMKSHRGQPVTATLTDRQQKWTRICMGEIAPTCAGCLPSVHPFQPRCHVPLGSLVARGRSCFLPFYADVAGSWVAPG